MWEWVINDSNGSNRVEFSIGNNYKDLVQQNVTQTLCNSHPKKSGKVAIEGSPIGSENCVTFTLKKVVKFHLESEESESKMFNSLNNIITRTGQKKREKRSVHLETSKKYYWALCNIYTRRVEQLHWKNEWKINRKKKWQCTRRKCENGSTMT